jgi:hypothetical protein
MNKKVSPANIPPENYENKDEYLDAVFDEIDRASCSSSPSEWTQQGINWYMTAMEVSDGYF